MSKTTIVVDTAESAELVKSVLDLRSDNGVTNVNNLIRLLRGINGGSYAGGTCRVIRNAVAATGILTFTGAPTADETFVLNGVTFTAKDSGATGNQFNIGGSVTLTAAAVVAAVNASTTAGVAGAVTASNVAGVVTFTAIVPGKAGNGFTVADSLTNATVTAANFTGGAEDQSLSFTV